MQTHAQTQSGSSIRTHLPPSLWSNACAADWQRNEWMSVYDHKRVWLNPLSLFKHTGSSQKTQPAPYGRPWAQRWKLQSLRAVMWLDLTQSNAAFPWACHCICCIWVKQGTHFSSYTESFRADSWCTHAGRTCDAFVMSEEILHRMSIRGSDVSYCM